MKIRKTLAEREAYVAEQVVKQTAQQTPQAAPEPMKRSKADSSRENLTKANAQLHYLRGGVYAPKPMTGTERSRRSRAKRSA
jgi:hypothetical protein